MANVLFISEPYLKDNSVINTNIEFKQLRPTIMAVQDMQIQQAIGSPMFEELKAQVIANNVTAANLTLITDYLQPAIMYWVLADSPLLLSYKFTNKGIISHNSDNAVNATQNEINFLAQNYKKKAEWYTERVTDYLCANHVLYPTYVGPVPDGGISPNQNRYTSGLFVGARPAQRRLSDGTGGIETFREPYGCDTGNNNCDC